MRKKKLCKALEVIKYYYKNKKTSKILKTIAKASAFDLHSSDTYPVVRQITLQTLQKRYMKIFPDFNLISNVYVT